MSCAFFSIVRAKQSYMCAWLPCVWAYVIRLRSQHIREGYCIIHNTERPQTELQTNLPTSQPHQIRDWQNQQNNPRQNQQQNHESIQVQPVEKHGICDRVFKAIKNKNTPQFYLLWHRRILSLHQPRPPEQSTRLSFSLRHHQRRRNIM